MSNRLVEYLAFIEPALCIAALVCIWRSRQTRRFAFLAAYLTVRAASDILLLAVAYFKLGYWIYFYTYWSSYAIEAAFGFGVIVGLYRLAMEPLPGLQRLGMLMFRWAAGIAIALAVTISFGPKVTGTLFIQRAVTQLQQTQSVLTLCMLLFVCLAIRPMGLSHRSKIFGVSFGLGITAATDLSISAWLSGLQSLTSVSSVISGCAILITLSVWVIYFALPEPARRMIILPTTSPFLRWNQISLALGDEPGFVAVGNVSPDMFAPAEVEIMRRASVKMRQLAT